LNFPEYKAVIVTVVPVNNFRRVKMEKRNLSDEVAVLKQYALDNYEAGGHWVFETYADLDYAEVVFEYPSLQACKEAIKEYWELCEEQKREYSW
jgi:hypothetical protein